MEAYLYLGKNDVDGLTAAFVQLPLQEAAAELIT
jgi:hypothetical protein